MGSLTIQGERPDSYEGHISVKVEPSVKYRPGIFIDINDHYLLAPAEPRPGTSDVLSILKTNWQTSITRGNAISESVVGMGDA
jgi:hypothetical protein